MQIRGSSVVSVSEGQLFSFQGQRYGLLVGKTATLEQPANLRVVVNLAVEHDLHLAVFVAKRLLSGAQIDDAQPPVSEHRTRGEAETSARTYAETFGYPEIVVHHASGDVSRMLLDVEPQPPYGRTPGTEA